MAMLEVKNLKVHYGVIQAIKGISFEVNEGEVIALIGANGAGKTTTLQTITGMLKPSEGEILFEGQDIVKVPGHKIVSWEMAQVPEGRARVRGTFRLRESEAGRLYQKRQKRDCGIAGKGLQEFPTSGRTKKPACRNVKRRRAADACNGARPDVQAEDHSDG